MKRTAPPASTMRWARQEIIRWFSEHGRQFPWRLTDDPYRVLIAEMLLRRTTATAVSRVYDDFISSFPTVEFLARADVDRIEALIRSLGLQSVRAKHLHESAHLILSEFDGRVPATLAELARLPGLGAYGAAAVVNFAFHQPVPLVDGNVIHLVNRFFGISFAGADDSGAWDFMQRFGGRKQDPHLYWGMIDLVALICLRRQPRCEQCPLRPRCRYFQDARA